MRPTSIVSGAVSCRSSVTTHYGTSSAGGPRLAALAGWATELDAARAAEPQPPAAARDARPPQYTNVVMPFEERPPRVPLDNPTGIYRRRFTLPRGWRGRRVILHFGGVEGAL